MSLSTKRLVVLFLAVVVFAAACGGDDASTDEPTGGDAPADSAAHESETAPPATDVDVGEDDSADGATATAEVIVAGFAFVPDGIEVPAGATVVWTNEDDTLHTVTPSGDDPTAFGGGLDGAGTTVEVTFDEPGTYEYFCSIHPGMVGAVTVT